MAVDLTNISVAAELERHGIHYEFGGGPELKIRCPFHDDSTPSCFINTEKREFKCQTAGCGVSGDFIALLAGAMKVSRHLVIIELSKHYDLEEEKVINATTIERFHEAIWKAPSLLLELYKRGITDNLIRKYRLGETENRVCIPIRGRSGVYVSYRKYLPGAPGNLKMRNARGFGKLRWFNPDQLQYDTIMLVGGECKAIVAADQLNAFDIGAISATCGEDNLSMEMLQDLVGKKVIVCMDIDAPGVEAAKRACTQLKFISSWVGNLLLPLDPEKYPKGDINDYIATEHGELKPLIDAVEEFTPEIADKLKEDASEPVTLELNEAIHANNSGKRLEVKGVVSAMDTTPFLIPKDVHIACPGSQPECALCPVFIRRQHDFRIPAESQSILRFIGVDEFRHLEVVKHAIGIPKSCRVCEFEKLSEYNVEDTRISPQLDVASEFGDRQPIPANCIGNGLRLNEGYEFTGKLFAHPKNQQATLLISGYSSSQNAFSNYSIEDAHELGIFWPKDWSVEGIQEKLDAIYSDFEYNITQIRQRRDMHLVADLAYHSVLFVPFNGKHHKGWVEAIIIGDSGQGKTDVAEGLQKHYNLGCKLDCKNVSVAGVLGGLVNMNERWFINWGVFPANDRGLVWLEELKGMAVETIASMTGMRSSGFAEVSKIGKQWKTHARTRWLITTNCKDDALMAQRTFGVTAIKELMGAPEDTRRLDIAIVVAKGEVPQSELDIPRDKLPVIEHAYSSDLCRQLVLWAWTRQASEVQFTPEATAAVLKYSSELCAIFSEDIPLVHNATMRLKLARLAAALAARLFSCSEDYSTLIIYPGHVEYIANLLKRIYSTPAFGYAEFSSAQQVLNTLLDPEEIKREINILAFPKDFCKSMLSRDFIEQQDLADWTGKERNEVNILLSLLVRKHALIRANRAYRKSSQFIALLKTMLVENGFVEIPEHIRNAKF